MSGPKAIRKGTRVVEIRTGKHGKVAKMFSWDRTYLQVDFDDGTKTTGFGLELNEVRREDA